MASFFVPRAVRKNAKQPVFPGKKNLNKSLAARKDNPTPVVVDFTAKAAETASKGNEILQRGSERFSNSDERTDKCTQEDDSDDEEIVSYSKNQRWPTTGEPVCVVCGRYGAYVCDKTDKDICSLECKSRHLITPAKQNSPPSESKRLPQDSINPLSFEGTDDLSCQAGSTCSEHGDSNESTSQRRNGFIYKEHTALAGLSILQVEQIRKNLEIQVKGEGLPKPVLEFSYCQFPEALTVNLQKSGYIAPTPVQMQVIPVGLQGRDVLACAQTGSGKTAAFLLPMITRIHAEIGQLPPHSAEHKCPLGLLLVPVRELGMQIENQAKELMHSLPHMKTALVVGGVPAPPQIHRLQAGVQIVIATPGRLLETLEQEAVDLSFVQILILDEVDCMLQMGFEHQVMQIIERLPVERQTMMFSATIPPPIEKLSTTLLQNPVFVSVGLPSTPTSSVKQLVLWVEDKSKKKCLFSLLQDPKHYKPPVVVFVDSKVGADLLAEAIAKVCAIPCKSMHGDKPQNERSAILQSFLAKDIPVLVCTAVLGRGVDLINVKQVINFDMPPTIEEYVHQVGRAGRLGASGWAMTFINNTNKRVFLDLVETLQPLGTTLPAPLLNSPFLLRARQRRNSERTSGTKRKHRDEFVNQGNLMELLKKSSTRRKR